MRNGGRGSVTEVVMSLSREGVSLNVEHGLWEDDHGISSEFGQGEVF